MRSQIVNFVWLGAAIATFALIAKPASAYWQFLERPPALRQSPHHDIAARKSVRPRLTRSKLRSKRPTLIGILWSAAAKSFAEAMAACECWEV